MIECKRCKNNFIEHKDNFHKTENKNEYHCSSCCTNFSKQHEPNFCPNKNCINNVIGIDGLVKCENCGNIWDGFAQCNCWQYEEEEEEEVSTQDTEIISQDTFDENEIKPPKLVRHNAQIIYQFNEDN
jgi:hypothetical protein